MKLKLKLIEFVVSADLRFPLDGSVRLHFSSGSSTRLSVADVASAASVSRIAVESSAGQLMQRFFSRILWDSLGFFVTKPEILRIFEDSQGFFEFI